MSRGGLQSEWRCWAQGGTRTHTRYAARLGLASHGTAPTQPTSNAAPPARPTRQEVGVLPAQPVGLEPLDQLPQLLAIHDLTPPGWEARVVAELRMGPEHAPRQGWDQLQPDANENDILHQTKMHKGKTAEGMAGMPVFMRTHAAPAAYRKLPQPTCTLLTGSTSKPSSCKGKTAHCRQPGARGVSQA